MGILANMINKSQGYETLKIDKSNLYELIKKAIYDCKNEKDYKDLKKALTASAFAQVKRYDSSSKNWTVTFDNPGLGRTSALVPEIRVFDHFNKKIYVFKGSVKSLRADAIALINNALIQSGVSAESLKDEEVDETEELSFTGEPAKEIITQTGTVICPVCGLETKANYLKCEFCGSEIIANNVAPETIETEEEEKPKEDNSQSTVPKEDIPSSKVEIEEEITEIFCVYCGKKIQKKNKFCNFCGKQNVLG